MDLPPPRRPARSLLDAAPKPALWRLGLGAVLAGAVWFLAAAAFVGLASRIPAETGTRERVFTLAYLLSFAGLAAGIALALRLLHRRRLRSLFGPDPAAFRRDFGRGAGVVALITVAVLPLAALGDPFLRQLSVATWAVWAPFAALAVLVQVAAEELGFRGYLQGGLAARFESPFVWWLLPALAFGLLHWNPQMGPNALLVVATATLIGLVAGDATARRGNLGLAIGLHFANNLVAVLLIAPPSPLSGLALYVSSTPPSDVAATRTGLLTTLGVVALAYAAWIWRRRPPGPGLHSPGQGSI